MELRQLRYFLAVVHAGGVRRAGLALRVVPSALSRALDQLDRHLGVELLVRSPDGVALTAAGRDFLPRAEAIVAAADDAADAMGEYARGNVILRLGAVAGVLSAGELTRPILRDFRATWPQITLRVRSIPFVDQVRPVLTNESEVAIVRAPLEHPDIEFVPLASEPRSLLVPRTGDLAGERDVALDDVLLELTIRLAGIPAWSGFFQLDVERGRQNVNPAATPSRDFGGIQHAVASGQGVISVGASAGRVVPQAANTATVRLRGAEPSVFGVIRRRRHDRAAVRMFIDSAVATASQNITLLPQAELS